MSDIDRAGNQESSSFPTSSTGRTGRPRASDQSFLENGIIDSTGVLELVAFLEQRFGITVADRELLPENLDSVQNASAFVTRKLAAQGAQVAG